MTVTYEEHMRVWGALYDRYLKVLFGFSTHPLSLAAEITDDVSTVRIYPYELPDFLWICER